MTDPSVPVIAGALGPMSRQNQPIISHTLHCVVAIVWICYCVHWVRNMETEKIGIREFRENLAGYLEGGRSLAITRHGETLGFFIPAQKRNRKAEVEAMRAAAKELDAMIASWGVSEDELMGEYKEIRQASREKKRNVK